jgi:hypothetical protein
MKVYKFIFAVGFLNLVVPFLGFPFVYKNYALITLAVITLGYALIVRAVEKERAAHRHHHVVAHADVTPPTPVAPAKKIEDVVEMAEHKEAVPAEEIVIKRRGRKPKAASKEFHE